MVYPDDHEKLKALSYHSERPITMLINQLLEKAGIETVEDAIAFADSFALPHTETCGED